MSAQASHFSLYVHIPYCVSKCPYCDFNSYVVAAIPEQKYTAMLLGEIDHYARQDRWEGRALQSIFFGGGTPSTFEPASIERILRHVASRFRTVSDCEITLEANPGTIDRGNFSGYRAAGVNRISVGVQSFQPRLLAFLGRAHSADDARRALKAVSDAGFENFSLDLIYANPTQTLVELEADITAALDFQPPHLSAYNLTIEEGTPFHQEYQSGRLRLLAEDQEIAMAQLIEERLSAAGLQRYEISNYARPGRRSRHNVNYWLGGDYLGVGAGAHSYIRLASNGEFGLRWWNEKHPARYMNRIEKDGMAVVEDEKSDRDKAAGEFMFVGLRLLDGISIQSFAQRFGKTPAEFYPQITDWLADGLMENQGNQLHLTRRGLMVANSIFVYFV
jgi:oxygen-independent coproporphyrinogen-3 oxidase